MDPLEAGPKCSYRSSTSDDSPSDPKPRFLFTVDGDQPTSVLSLVYNLVADACGELIIGSPINLPEQTSKETLLSRRKGERLASEFAWKAKQRCDDDFPIQQVVSTGHGRDAVIRNMVDRYHVSTVIIESLPGSCNRGPLGLGAINGEMVPESCDTIIVSRVEKNDGIDSILIPIARGPHSGVAIETGLALARQTGAKLEILHVYGGDDGLSNGEQLLEIASDRLNGYETVEKTLLESDDIPDAIIEYADSFDVTVLGAPREGKLRQFILGTIPEAVSEHTNGSVLIAHRGGDEKSWLDRWV